MTFDLARIERSFISKYWIASYYDNASCPSNIISALQAGLPHIASEEWPGRLAWGGVYVNGLPVFSDVVLGAPCKVEYYEPRFKIENAADFFPKFDKEFIVYEDDDLLAVFKPAGLPCHPAKEQIHFNLRTYVEGYLGHAVHMPSRLDMSTQGLVLISKSARMHGRCQKLFAERRINKFYLCEVSGRPEWDKLEMKKAIARDSRHAVLRRVVELGGKDAHTTFTRLSDRTYDRQPCSIVLAQPHSGRTHQIRVHLSALGHPIIGDNFYQGPEAPELRLLSFKIEFLHPYLGRNLSVSLPERLLPPWGRNGLTI